MKANLKYLLVAAGVISVGWGASSAHATNGMNLEGYGARAHAMGGAASGYDSGNSAIMNNPATLSLWEGKQRVGVGLRMLGPDVDAESTASSAAFAKSDGDAYFMPSFSYMRNSGKFTYGFGVIAQGGMGTEYAAGNTLFAQGRNTAAALVDLSGLEQRSELSVGRAVLPLSYRVNEKLNVAASVDFVWMGLDLKMDLDGANFAAMATAGTASGALATNAFAASGGDIDYGRFDFSDGNDFTGEAKGYGAGFKLGATYQLTNAVTLGLSYHSKTAMEDLSTEGATVYLFEDGGAINQTIPGTITVKDFEWPQKATLGAAYQFNKKLMLVGDVSWIDWSNTMKDFKMEFVANSTNATYAGQAMNVTLEQNWKDQYVLSLGAEYALTDQWRIRGGANIGNNPVPNDYLSILFPATVTNHITGGFGYTFANGGQINAAVAYAPGTDNVATGNVNTDSDVKLSHGQYNWSLNYSYDF
ncbi:OmpP1/FadL family transporter [Magnetococcus sp. PR-3]|uniref:OmpP1/FadL family transporter n=1 Tax=Magnetococcus sp. PR-3 TaxID=3120355 RepID=UPI002FCDFC11